MSSTPTKPEGMIYQVPSNTEHSVILNKLQKHKNSIFSLSKKGPLPSRVRTNPFPSLGHSQRLGKGAWPSSTLGSAAPGAPLQGPDGPQGGPGGPQGGLDGPQGGPDGPQAGVTSGHCDVHP